MKKIERKEKKKERYILYLKNNIFILVIASKTKKQEKMSENIIHQSKINIKLSDNIIYSYSK